MVVIRYDLKPERETSHYWKIFGLQSNLRMEFYFWFKWNGIFNAIAKIKKWDLKLKYRRANTKGGTYFFTVNLAERNKTLLVDHINELRAAFKKVKISHPFIIDAVVILPEHIHSIWTLPENDADFSTRWRLIKSWFSKSLPKTERVHPSRMNKSERGIWQRRFWEHQIRDENDYIRHMDYLYYNPVKHGYVKHVIDWPYSSFHREVDNGVYARDWGRNVVNDGKNNLDVGEAKC